jgi:hypothetical protein
MTVALDHDVVRLSGHCTAEDAELLLKHLVAGARRVDLSSCDHLHGAVVQLLMATRPAVLGEPAQFVRDWLIPLICEPDSP